MSRPTAADCHYYLPRLGTGCEQSASFVVDYARGVGACPEHLGKVVAWVLEDSPTAEVLRWESWTYRQDSATLPPEASSANTSNEEDHADPVTCWRCGAALTPETTYTRADGVTYCLNACKN